MGQEPRNGRKAMETLEAVVRAVWAVFAFLLAVILIRHKD